MAIRPRLPLLIAVSCLAALQPAAAEKKPKAQFQPGAVDASGTYQMSPEEQALDCKQLTGKMQVRILQIRDFDPNRKPSMVGKALQTIHAPLIQGSKRGMDPAAEHQADIAMLKAYNKRLAEKKCRTFDLDAELKPQAVTATPRPTAPAAK